MKFIRGPVWDIAWIWSGGIIGIALVILLNNPFNVWLLAIITVLEIAHNVSPVFLSWSNRVLRAIVRREWREHIALPIAILTTIPFLPWSIVMGVYFAWNIWHFASQLFGISCLYRPCSNLDERFWRLIICLSVMITVFVGAPFFSFKAQLFLMGAVSFGHWLSDIGLSSEVSDWHPIAFVASVLACGLAWLILRNGPLSVNAVPQILAIRAGAGMVHFIYSRRNWRMSDPAVRGALKPIMAG